MDIQYIFYYKVNNGIEHISCDEYSFDEDNGSSGRKYYKIGKIEKLIEFIKHKCTGNVSVVFEGFDSSKILYILNNIADEIDTYATSHDNAYYMFKRITKKRGKNNGMD